jgi:hypothetical protein
MDEIRRKFPVDESQIDPSLKNRIFSPDGDEVVGYWDGESIQDLEKELDRIEERVDANYNSLPHHYNIPKDFFDKVEKDYPVWACDKKGECLVGEGPEIRIEKAEVVRDFYINKYGSIEAFHEKLALDRKKFMDSLEDSR